MRLHVLSQHVFGVAAIALACFASAASAATFTWDNSNISGDGNSTLNWFNAPQAAWGGGTPVQDDPTTVIQFFSGTAAGNALANTGTLTQSAIIDGTSGFQLSTLNLLGRGSATGSRPVTMTISGSGLNFAAATGTIQFNSVNGGNGSIVNHTILAPIQLGSLGTPGELTIDTIGSNNGAPNGGGYRIDGVIEELAAGGSLVKTGGNTVYLSAANTFSGGVTINGGKLAVGVASGTSAATVLGTGPLTINAGTFEINGNVAGVVSQTVGSLSGSSAASLVLNNRSLTFGSLNTDTVYAGNVSGSLIKVGTGTTTLFAAGSTLSNVTLTVSEGVVKLGASKTFTSGQLGGTLDLDGFSITSSLARTGLSFSLLTGGGTFTNSSQQLFFGSDIAGSGTGTIRGNYQMTSNPNFRAGNQAGTKVLVIDGVLSGGAGNITNSGNGFSATLQLTGSLSNTFTGTWAMSAGTTDLAKTGGAIAIPTNVRLGGGVLRWQAAEQIADTSELTLTNNNGLNLNGYTETVSHLVSGAGGGFNPTTSGTLILAGNTTNLITIASGVNVTKELGLDLRLTGTGGILLTTATNQNRTMRIGSATAGQYSLDLGDTTRTVTVAGASYPSAPGGVPALITSLISGSGGLIKDGDGLLRLSAANTFTGPTRLDAGTLDLGGNRLALQNSVVDFSGLGVLTNYSTTPVFGGLANYSGFILENTVTRLTLNVLAGGTQTYSILPSGGAATIGFGKAGGGTLVFTGNSAWSGATTIDGGVLEVGSLANAGQSGPLGSGTTVRLGASDSTGTLRYTGSGETSDRVVDLGGTTGGGGIEANGSGGLALTSPLTATGLGAKTLTLSGTSTAVNSIAAITGDDVSVTKTGPTTWRLTEPSSFTGRLTVKEGTVVAAVGAGQTGNGVFGAGTGDTLPLVGDSAVGATGQAAVLLDAGVFLDRGLVIAASGSGATQEAILGTSATSGTARFGSSGSSINLGRDLTLQAADGGTVAFANVWQDLASGTTPAVAFNVGSAGNAGTVVFESVVPDSITAVNVRRGTLRLGPGGPDGDETIGFATPVTIGETGAGGTLDVNGSVQSLASLSFAGVGSGVSDGFGSGSLTLYNAGSAATVNVSGTGHTISAAVDLDDAAAFTVQTGGRLAISSAIADGFAGPKGITKAGPGILELAGANTFTGNTTVSAGTLVVNGSLANGALSVAAGATLMGSGTIGGAATISGIHAPGNSPGVETFADNLTYSGGSSQVVWELWGNTDTNSPTVTFDQIVVGSNLDFAAPTSLELSFGGLGNGTVDWDDSFWGGNQTWTLFDVTGTTSGFSNFILTSSPASWLDSSGQAFSSSVRSEGSFSVAQQGQDVLIQYAVPEPATMLLALAGLGLAAVAGRRRR